MFEAIVRSAEGGWDALDTFDTEEEARVAIEELRGIDAEWREAEMDVREIREEDAPLAVALRALRQGGR